MISWIQKYFQRHFRSVFVALLAITIFTFILGINAAGGLGRATGREQASRPFFGLDLANAQDRQRFLSDANTSQTLHIPARELALYRQLGANPPFDENGAYLRQAALWLADQYHLPLPGKADIEAHVRALPFFANADGQFEPALYNTFLDNVTANPNFTLADVTRVLSDDIRVSQVESLLVGPGYLLPSEARSLVELNDSSWTLAIATVDYASFAPAIPDPAPADLEKFFAADPKRYEIHPQVRVDAVEFPAEAFLPKVTLTDKEVRDRYDADKNHLAFPLPPAPPELLAKAADPAAKDAADFAAVRPKIEEAMKLDRARRLAEEAAASLAGALFDQKITPATLAPLLAARSLALKNLPSFAADAPPANLGRAATAAAFRLDADRPFSDALTTDAGAVVLVWRENLAARQPAYAEVRDRVAADWRADEKRRRFTELGSALHDRLAAAVKAGTPFEEAVTAAAASASSAKIEVKNQTGFTLAQKRDSGSFDVVAPLLKNLESLQKGQLTDMVSVPSDSDAATPKEGLIALAVDKKIPSPDAPEAAAHRAMIARQTAAYAAQMVLADLVKHELPQPAKE